MKKLFKKIKSKFKKVYCKECKHCFLSDSIGLFKSEYVCHKRPVYSSIKSDLLYLDREEDEKMKISYYDFCKKSRPFPFCFQFEKK